MQKIYYAVPLRGRFDILVKLPKPNLVKIYQFPIHITLKTFWSQYNIERFEGGGDSYNIY